MKLHRRVPAATAWLVGLAMLGVTPEAAQAQHAEGPVSERTIRVTGAGEVQMKPDEARITFAVETMQETARAAGAENARRMDRLISALMAAGVPRGDIETRQYALHPEHVHEEGREPRLRGYRATNRVVLKTREIGRAGELIDMALAAGANRVDGIHFVVTDPSAGSAEALTEAVARARGSAEAIAAALGVELGEVLDASTSAAPPQGPRYMQRMDMEAAAASAPTPIEPGEQTLRATVSIVYAIVGGR